MITHVAKWGNSLALRLPAALAREIEAAEGKAVDIAIENGALVIRPVEEPKEFNLDQLLSGITEENLHGETTTGAAVGSEF